MKSSEYLWFSNEFKGHRSYLIHLNSLSIKKWNLEVIPYLKHFFIATEIVKETSLLKKV